jgi:hypothetical protein
MIIAPNSEAKRTAVSCCSAAIEMWAPTALDYELDDKQLVHVQ